MTYGGDMAVNFFDWLLPCLTQQLGSDAMGTNEDEDVSLTEANRAYLEMLEMWLGMYSEMRTTE